MTLEDWIDAKVLDLIGSVAIIDDFPVNVTPPSMFGVAEYLITRERAEEALNRCNVVFGD